MARPKKDNAEYFSHDADMRNDVKVKALRRRFSHKGYAVWCFILETLTNEEFFEVKYNEIGKELLAADFDIQVKELDDIVDYCIKVNLLQMEEDRLFSNRHKERFNEMMTNRQKKSIAGKLGMKKRWGDIKRNNEHDNIDNTVITTKQDDITEDSKGKESKEKESKEKNIVYPYQDIAELWNSACSRLPKIIKVTEGRKQKIKSRFQEFGKNVEESIQVYQAILEKVSASDFLNGENNSNWTATFDWLFDNPKNWVKVSEGNYDNKRGAKSAAVSGANNLGAGEYIDNTGKRTYGTGKANIPMSAPARPSESYTWDESSKKWIML